MSELKEMLSNAKELISIDCAKHYRNNSRFRERELVKIHKQFEYIDSLLDKEAPMKPKKNDISNHDQFNNFCSRCGGSLFYSSSGCINNDCRQKIDWCDEE